MAWLSSYGHTAELVGLHAASKGYVLSKVKQTFSYLYGT